MAEIKQDPITAKIIGCCFDVHNVLGPGFPEKIYHGALKSAFEEKDISYSSEQEFNVHFNKKRVGTFRCDLFVEKNVILEIKAVNGIMPLIFRNQLIAYLKASGIKTGLLVNFGNKSCGVKRVSV